MMAVLPAMTAVSKCPSCDGERVRLLPALSERARVDYYRCYCSHVWSVDKETQLIEHVTPLPSKLRCVPRH
jgi:hypothetical protein